MEVNPNNAIIRDLKRQVDTKTAGAAATSTATLLYETSLLTSGFSVESPSEFATRVFSMMANSVKGGSGAAATGSEPPKVQSVSPDEVVTPPPGGDAWSG